MFALFVSHGEYDAYTETLLFVSENEKTLKNKITELKRQDQQYRLFYDEFISISRQINTTLDKKFIFPERPTPRQTPTTKEEHQQHKANKTAWQQQMSDMQQAKQKEYERLIKPHWDQLVQKYPSVDITNFNCAYPTTPYTKTYSIEEVEKI